MRGTAMGRPLQAPPTSGPMTNLAPGYASSPSGCGQLHAVKVSRAALRHMHEILDFRRIWRLPTNTSKHGSIESSARPTTYRRSKQRSRRRYVQEELTTRPIVSPTSPSSCRRRLPPCCRGQLGPTARKTRPPSIEDCCFRIERMCGMWTAARCSRRFSDSAFAEDRCFGYTLGSWCDAWGPEGDPFDELSADASDEVYETTEAAYTQKSCLVAGSVDGWIIDAEAMCAYASVRYFLRTLTLRDYDDVNDAARELFVRDLRDEPQGLRRFSALVSPIHWTSD